MLKELVGFCRFQFYFHGRFVTMVKKSRHLTQLIELNLAMVLMSTSGTLGRYITMPPPVTIWWRCLFAAIFLGLFCWFWRVQLTIRRRRDFSIIFFAALLLGGHWITYFFALQYSSVAIGMLSLFTYPAITSFLEPLILKTRFRVSHILLGILVIVGIYLLAPSLDLKNDYTKGIAFGLLSSVMYSSVFNSGCFRSMMYCLSSPSLILRFVHPLRFMRYKLIR